jgi:two-component system cell cycle response regulator
MATDAPAATLHHLHEERHGTPSSTTQPNMPAVGWRPLRSPERATTERFDENERPTDPGEPPRRGVAVECGTLVRMDGAEAGRIYVIAGGETRIGRGGENDIVIDDSGVSRRHACVVCRGSEYSVDDAGSRNGTVVRGHRVQSARLRPGDYVQLGGRATLSFQVLDGQQQDLLRQLYESSTQDALTKVSNRKHFTDRLAAEVAFSRRHGTSLGLLLIDIDLFKRVNDQYGHAAGDSVLMQLAATLARELRAEDFLARVGGEEFAVVLRGIVIEGCASLAERLRARVAARSLPVGEHELAMTISAGCAALKGTEVSAHGLMAIADERLYEAKRQGRNRIVASGGGRAEKV